MSLMDLKKNEIGEIIFIDIEQEKLKRYLLSLGFYNGSKVQFIQGNDVTRIFSVKGTRYAINFDIFSKILIKKEVFQ